MIDSTLSELDLRERIIRIDLMIADIELKLTDSERKRQAPVLLFGSVTTVLIAAIGAAIGAGVAVSKIF